MNITVAWNVWNNYEDVLLGAEIFRFEDERLGLFEQVKLIAQGGYEVPPNEEESTYLNEYFHIDIDETHPLIHEHVKFKGIFRVLNGIKRAYEYGLESESDFVVVTNADAWFLDLEKLHTLLNRDDVQNAAISARVGACVGMHLNYGDFVPFFDDHFLILNVKKCFHLNIFNYDKPIFYNSIFVKYGSIHYMLVAMMDEIVPDGMFNIYTMVEDGVNHYNESSAYSLLPWQYQPSTGFLHANCAQEPYLHHLRAYQLEVLGFDRFPKVRIYCQNHDKRDNLVVDPTTMAVFFKKTLKENLEFFVIKMVSQIKNLFYRHVLHKVFLDYMRDSGSNCMKYFELYRTVLPLSYVSRRPLNKDA